MKFTKLIALAALLCASLQVSKAQFISPVTPGNSASSQPPASVKKTINQVSHGFSRGQWVRVSAPNVYALAQANSVANSDVVGLVDAVVDANNFQLVSKGYVTGYAGFTGGTTYYLSNGTAGAITPAIPNTNPKKVFYAVSANEGYVSIGSALYGTQDAVTVGGLTASNAITANGAFSTVVGANFTTVGVLPAANLGTTSFVKLAGATAQTLSGIVGGTNGRTYIITNAATQNAVLKNDDATAPVGNRILTGSGADLTLAPNATVKIIYDFPAQYWRVVGGVGSASGQDTIQTTSTAGAQPVLQWNSLVDANATAGAQTVQLPLAAGNIGKTIGVIKTDASTNAVTITSQAGDTITSIVPLVLSANGQTLTFKVVAANTIRVIGNVANSVLAEFGTVGITGSVPTPGTNFTGTIAIPSAGTWRITWRLTGDTGADAGTVISLVNNAGTVQGNGTTRSFQSGVHQFVSTSSVFVTTIGAENFFLRMVTNGFTTPALNVGGSNSFVTWEKIAGFAPFSAATVTPIFWKGTFNANSVANSNQCFTSANQYSVTTDSLGILNNSTGLFTNTTSRTVRLVITGAIAYNSSTFNGGGRLMTYLTGSVADRIGWGFVAATITDFVGHTLAGTIELPPGQSFSICTQQNSGSTKTIASGADSPLTITEVPRTFQ
jgi:hypothetical protein